MRRMSVCILYITCANKDEARKIAAALLERQLIACANILPSVESHFRWQDALEQTEETAMFAKTTDAKLKEIYPVVTSLHSYDTPCIVALPITDGLPEFLKWVGTETH